MSNKSKFILSIIGVVASITLLVAATILMEKAIIDTPISVVFITVSVILVLAAIAFAAKVDYETGVYQCRNCGHIFKPKFKAYLFGMHSLTTRRLNCPKCGKTTWCKRKSAGSQEADRM